jgi:hypothetical protein
LKWLEIYRVVGVGAFRRISAEGETKHFVRQRWSSRFVRSAKRCLNPQG